MARYARLGVRWRYSIKLLLHTCCGPCSVMVTQGFIEDGYDPDLYFYNPNIHPSIEYLTRLDSLRQLTDDKGLKLILADTYDMEEFIKKIASNPSTRCQHCYRMRLMKTASYARENGYEYFSTTLSVSPYQDHDLLREIGNSIAIEVGVTFVYRDFREQFREGQKVARGMNLYMQKYCGCIYSEAERYRSRIQQNKLNG